MAGVDLILSSLCNGSVCEVNNTPIIDNFADVQITKKQEYLLNLTKDLNGKHLKIATYFNFPLSYVQAGPNGTLIGLGVAFTIIQILQKRFNFTYDVVVPKKNFLNGGTRPEDSVIGLTNSSQVDMAAVFIPRISNFQKYVSFSLDVDEGVWQMVLRRPKASAAGSGLMAPFDSFVWYLTLAAVLAYGPCITFITAVRSKILRDKERHLSLSPSFWFVYSAFIKQGTNLAPDANATRILFATWWLFIILLSAFYTANLTAFLTLSKFTLEIETTEDLFKKNYRWMAAEGGSVQFLVTSSNEDLYYLNKMVANGRAQFKNFGSDEGYFPFIDGGGVLIEDSFSINHLMYRDYLNKAKQGVAEADRCTYVVAPKNFMKKPRGFGYPQGSPLKILFDTVLIQILQAGIIDYLEHSRLPRTKICPLDLQSKDRQLQNSDLLMTYLIMVVGLATAIAVFVGEVFFKRCLNKKKPEDPAAKANKGKLKGSEDKQDESQPPPYDSLFGNPKYNINENTQRKIINGREYYMYNTSNGDTRLIPVRTPSALLYR